MNASHPGRADVAAVEARVTSVFARHAVQLTIGGEPTFVPVSPKGDEWHHAAVGPTKLAAAEAMASQLQATVMSRATAFFAPGKCYADELDPRWVIWLVQERDGTSIMPRIGGDGAASPLTVAALRRELLTRLQIEDGWRRFDDPADAAGGENRSEVWALLLDRDDCGWSTRPWPAGACLLTTAAGPAGLRLPLDMLPDNVPRRAVVLERRGDRLAIFLPPLLQEPFVELLTHLAAAVREAGIGAVDWQGSIPPDDAGRWTTLGLTADPGVLEVNLPACHSWREYDFWLRAVNNAAAACGLRSWRQPARGLPEDSGGGGHLLWGGPTPADNPFFSRPGWVASILRYWQQHPALSYVFSGKYVGPHSQAPRADESGASPHDLEWAWASLDQLPPGEDHREAIAAAVRFLQTDVAANSHRSEICFDKFWHGERPAGRAGLIEFRALASLPEAGWSSSVALLWQAIAAWLLDHRCRQPVRSFGRSLHDRHLLPTVLWNDLTAVLADLHRGGFPLDPQPYRAIWSWRFPPLLEFVDGDAMLSIRQAAEPWPLISSDSGTSRLVDTSLQRFECAANHAFRERFQLRVAGRLLPLAILPRPTGWLTDAVEGDGCWLAGLRYRKTWLQWSLHPSIPRHIPLLLEIISNSQRQAFVLDEASPLFTPHAGPPPPPGPACQPLVPGDLTYDLRVAG
jgi:uncharacterized protein (DUF2126 family)